MNTKEICKVVDAANRMLCSILGEQVSFEYDTWSEQTKTNMAKSVATAITGGSPEDSHNAWMKSRLEEGWVYGKVKDVATKTSPCLVPYDELPIEQKVKDDLFINICKALAPLLRGE
jgi:hypothetical protein